MSLRQIIGWLLLALPFLTLGTFIVVKDGWGVMFTVFGGVAITVAVVGCGVWLAFG